MSVSLGRQIPVEWYQADGDEWELLLLSRGYEELQAELTDLVHIAEATDRAIKRQRRVGLIRQRDALDRTIQRRVVQIVGLRDALRMARVDRVVGVAS